MRGKLLLPLGGLAVIITAVFTLWYRGLHRAPIADPPIPVDLRQTEPAVVDLIHQARSKVLLEKRDPMLWLELGKIYEANTNNLFARECYEQSVVLEPRCAECWFHAAQARYATSEYEPAIEAMRKVIDLQGEYGPAHWRLGFWLLDQGDLLGAEAAFNRATQLGPRDPAGWFGMAMVRLRQNRNEEAARILEQVLEWTPINRFYANQLLGDAYRRLGRIDEAERVLKNSAGREIVWPDPWTNSISNYHRGAGWKIELPMQLLGQGRIREAIGMLEGFLRNEPDNSILLSNLAIAYRTDGQLDRSIETIKKAIALREHYHQAHFNLGLACLMKADEATDPKEVAEYERLAMEHAEFALSVNPSYPSGHGLKGQLLERRGDDEAALEHYHIACKDVSSGQYWLALQIKLLMKLKRWNEAVDSLDLLMIRYVPQPENAYDLALCLLRAGRYEDAVNTANRFQQRWPNDPRVTDLRREIGTYQGTGPSGPQSSGDGR